MVGTRGRVSSILCALIAGVVSTFPTHVHAGCSDPQGCAYTLSGRMTVAINVRDVSGKHPPSSLQTTLSFSGNRVLVSIAGLQPGLYTMQIRSVRGFATISSGGRPVSERIPLTHRGKQANVVLGDPEGPVVQGPRAHVDIPLKILSDLNFPMADSDR